MLQAVADQLIRIPLIEVGALAFGIAYVALAARNIVWCWPAGIIASAFSLAVAAESNYRLDVIKEAYYIGMGFYGWYAWTHIRRLRADRPITTRSTGFHMILIAACTAISIAIGWWFSRMGSSLPYLDAATTIFAFSTTWLAARRVLENWLYWIVINTASVYMYIRTEAYVFSGLIAIYGILAIVGYLTWRRLRRSQRDDEVAGAPIDTAGG